MIRIENIQTDLQRQLEEFRLGLLSNSLFSNNVGDGTETGGGTQPPAAEDEGIDPEARARMAMACALFLNRKRAKAKQEAERALEIAPDNFDLRQALEPIVGVTK